MKNKKKKDIYIETIEYGRKRLNDKLTTSKEDLKIHLISKGFDIQDDRFLNTIFLECFGTLFMKNNMLSGTPTYLNSDTYFRLLNYEGLKHARKSAKEARTIAIIAIFITGLSFIASIVLSFT